MLLLQRYRVDVVRVLSRKLILREKSGVGGGGEAT